MFMVALAAMSLASCSNDNVIETAKPGEIKFNATTANASRAAAVYSATELMPKFTVNAAYLAEGETTYRNYIQNAAYLGINHPKIHRKQQKCVIIEKIETLGGLPYGCIRIDY